MLPTPKRSRQGPIYERDVEVCLSPSLGPLRCSTSLPWNGRWGDCFDQAGTKGPPRDAPEGGQGQHLPAKIFVILGTRLRRPSASADPLPSPHPETGRGILAQAFPPLFAGTPRPP